MNWVISLSQKAGVKVPTFSIGFGPVVWSKRVGETDYQLALLPFGGFVAMEERGPDENGQIPEDSFAAKNKGWQAAILAAGVVFNLVSSYVMLLLLAWVGLPQVPPVVGEISPIIYDNNGVEQRSPAAELGLLPGDRILRYNDQPVRSIEDILYRTIQIENDPITLDVQRGDRTITLGDGQDVGSVFDVHQGRRSLGFSAASAAKIVAATGDAQAASLVDWHIVGVNGEDVSGLSGQQIKTMLRPSTGREVTLSLESPDKSDQPREVTITYGGSMNGGADALAAAALGLPIQIVSLVDGAAQEAGLQAGDIIESVDGVPIVSSASLMAELARVVKRCGR